VPLQAKSYTSVVNRMSGVLQLSEASVKSSGAKAAACGTLSALASLSNKGTNFRAISILLIYIIWNRYLTKFARFSNVRRLNNLSLYPVKLNALVTNRMFLNFDKYQVSIQFVSLGNLRLLIIREVENIAKQIQDKFYNSKFAFIFRCKCCQIPKVGSRIGFAEHFFPRIRKIPVYHCMRPGKCRI
jgi:hypothetical protein